MSTDKIQELKGIKYSEETPENVVKMFDDIRRLCNVTINDKPEFSIKNAILLMDNVVDIVKPNETLMDKILEVFIAFATEHYLCLNENKKGYRISRQYHNSKYNFLGAELLNFSKEYYNNNTSKRRVPNTTIRDIVLPPVYNTQNIVDNFMSAYEQLMGVKMESDSDIDYSIAFDIERIWYDYSDKKCDGAMVPDWAGNNPDWKEIERNLNEMGKKRERNRTNLIWYYGTVSELKYQGLNNLIKKFMLDRCYDYIPVGKSGYYRKKDKVKFFISQFRDWLINLWDIAEEYHFSSFIPSDATKLMEMANTPLPPWSERLAAIKARKLEVEAKFAVKEPGLESYKKKITAR